MRQGLSIAAILVVALLPLLCGCVVDKEAVHDKAKRTSDGREKKSESNSETSVNNSTDNRSVEITITSPSPGLVSIDPNMLPEVPEGKAPRVTTLSPQPVTAKEVNERGDVVRILESSYLPGGTVTFKSDTAQTREEGKSLSSSVSVDEAWKAVRNVPAAVWTGLSVGLGFGILILVFGGRYRLLGLLVVGVSVFAAMAIVIAYTQGEVLAYAFGGVVVAGGLLTLLTTWLVLRGKIKAQASAEFFQAATNQIIAGGSRFLEKNTSDEAATLFKSCQGKTQDSDIQDYVKSKKF